MDVKTVVYDDHFNLGFDDQFEDIKASMIFDLDAWDKHNDSYAFEFATTVWDEAVVPVGGVNNECGNPTTTIIVKTMDGTNMFREGSFSDLVGNYLFHKSVEDEDEDDWYFIAQDKLRNIAESKDEDEEIDHDAIRDQVIVGFWGKLKEMIEDAFPRHKVEKHGGAKNISIKVPIVDDLGEVHIKIFHIGNGDAPGVVNS